MAEKQREEESEEERRLYIGVDVGTASVRAGLFSEQGVLITHDEHEIKIWENELISEGSYEQSSEDIWHAVCHVVKTVIQGIDPSRVNGIGFDATCSLVAVDANGCPVSVSPSNDPQRNIILWKDHRAVHEADYINNLNHPVLKFVGGCISPEMQPPKLLWLKKHLANDCWSKVGYFFDLADYLVYKSTSVPIRSLCTLVCKWSYIGHRIPKDSSTQVEGTCLLSEGWNDSFWHEIGLGDLVEGNYTKIGTLVGNPGERVGDGLTRKSASQLGLVQGTDVAIALIDAHAGGLGMLGADLTGLPIFSLKDVSLTNRLAIIAGTSTCHMASSILPLPVPGVWGPYYSAMVPGYFLNEGGQSAAGSLVDHILRSNHAAFEQLKHIAQSRSRSIYSELDHTLSDIAKIRSVSNINLLTNDIHLLPDFHGNRSPMADPALRGMISGLSLSNSIEEMAILYLATIQALAYGTKHIIEVMTSSGHCLNIAFVCGGLGKNSLFLQTHANVTGIHVLLPKESESVLLGSAILAKAAADRKEVKEVMREMARVSDTSLYTPTKDSSIIRYHQKKYNIFKAMLSDQLKYRELMKN